MSSPALRFKDKNGENYPDWEESTYGKIIFQKSKKFDPTKSKEHLKCIELEHLSQSTGKLLGFTEAINQKSIKNRFNEGEILFGKLRPYLKKYLKAPFDGVCSTEIWVLSGIKVSNDFLYQLVQTENFLTIANKSTGSKMPRADWGVIYSSQIQFPSKEEQTKIANFLALVDEKIIQLTKKYELLSQYKKGVMQKIFTQELRFKNNAGENFPIWEEKEIKEIFKITRGNVLAMPKVSNKKSDSHKYPVYSSQTKNGGLSGYYDEYLFENCITWTTDGANAGDVNFRKGKFYCTNVCGVLENDNGYANTCIAAMINNVSKKYVSYVGNPKLMNGVMAKISIAFPSVDEQNKISLFLTAIDEKITSTQSQLELLKQYKQGLLQQMFF
jgi:type I restriction enzyme S subunit